MTSDFSNSPQHPQEQFDTGPLSWVMTEVREAISSAGKMLTDALGQDDDTRSTSLLHAKSYLHQAHGALQIVDIDGVSIVTETIEELLERLQNKQLAMTQSNVDVIVDAFHAVLRYLEDLLSGAAHQPVRLFPYYRALLEIKGAERIHPADLFFPSLVAQEQIPELTVTGQAPAISYAAVRQRFEKLLLPVLTAKDPLLQRQAVQAIHDLILEVAHAQPTSQTKAFWVVMQAFSEAVASGDIPNQPYVKQIFGRINLQIRRLVDGATTLPERLLRDALFFLAQVETPSPLVSRVRTAYQLDNQVPVDYDQKNYGKIAAGALATAKEQLSAVKNFWGRIANGENGLAEKFSQKIKDLADTGSELNSPALAKLLRELSGIARHVAHSPDGSKLGLELATSLLFVENALDQISRLPAHFSERADEITSRLLSVVSGDEPQAQAAWIGEISREAQQRQTMGVLVSEMQASLRQVEKNLDEYFRDPSNTDSLKPVDGILHQIGGALAVLDQDDAMLAVEHTRNMVHQFANAPAGAVDADSAADSVRNAKEHHLVAQNIGALSFFIETMQAQPETAKKKFTFDQDAGVFRSNLLEVQASKELLPTTNITAAPGHPDADMVSPEAAHTTEQELHQQQQESARLAASLAEAPHNEHLQAQLKESLESERAAATLLDDADASDRAKAAIDILGKTDFATAPQSAHDIVVATSSVADTRLASPVVALPQSDEAIDAELLEIFLSEADEVLAFVQQTLPASRHDPDNQEYLTSLRRSFHTLKGSSRMVGLTVFGEAAWHIEQVMNMWLSESRDGTETLYTLLSRTADEMLVWVDELKRYGHSARTGAALIAAAERIKAGLDIDDAVADASELPTSVIPESLTEVLPEPETQLATEFSEADLSLDVPELDFSSSETPTVDANTDSTIDYIAIDAPELGDVESVVSQAPVLPELNTETVKTDLVLDFEDELALEPEAGAENIVAAISTELAPFDILGEEIPGDLAMSDILTDAVTNVGEEPSAVTEAIEAEEAPIEITAEVPDITNETVESDELIPELIPSETIEATVPDIDVTGEIEELGLPPETPPETGLKTESITESAPTVVSGDELIASLNEATPDAGLLLDGLPLVIAAGSDATTQITVPDVETADVLSDDLVSEIDAIDVTSAVPLPDQVAETLAETVVPEITEGRSSAKIIEFPDLTKPTVLQDDNVKRIGNIEISLPLYSIYMAETDEIVRFLGQDFSEWRHEPHRHVSTHAIHATHTLAGSSATVGLKPLQELAHSLELVLQRLERHPVPLLASEYDVLDKALDTSKRMLQKFALSEMAPSAPTEIYLLEALLQEVIERSDAGADEEFITSTNEALNLSDLADISEVASDVATEVASPADIALPANVAAPEVLTPEHVVDSHIQIKDDLDMDLLPVFIEEGNDLLPMVGQLLRSWQEQPDDTATPQSIARLMHTIKGSARMAGAMALGQHIHDMETRIESLVHTGGIAKIALLEDLLARHDYSMQLFDRLQNPDAYVAPPQEQALTAAQELDQFQEAMLGNEHTASVAEKELINLAPVMPVIDRNALRTVTNTSLSNTGKSGITPSTSATSATPTPTAPVPLVRVRADILDRLVNQAGEVSISRSRLENEVGTLRSSLTELTENVNRLRDQLREVEIQAETQITSRMAHSADREFDPLEFDRFTRLQELTRMMAESVSDVATVQTNLTRTIDGATNDLHMQARLTRELQQDLMRVRMIPFASISERLYRVTRQTSKEVDKRVNLDIRGAGVEMDRGVLEKMVGPFEHLLRNAIVHGIESRDERRQHHKDETGELLIEVRQEGNEVVIRFSDDGQGLDLPRIREKAKVAGLIGHDAEPADIELAHLIFEPGLSTANEVSELAGRGVGMDVVRSEAASLGGRVEVSTTDGKGAEFTIRLPLTLAVTQVVLLNAGGRTYAVPSVLVEQVQQLKSSALVSAYNDGAVMWQGQRVPMYFLSTMLGQYDVTPMTQQYTPLLILKSGTDRVAIHVDDIVGNREVVVKNIGPQLARMAGIAGATVLGSGEIVLILNPVPLAQKMEQEHARLQPLGIDISPEMGAVADLHSKAKGDDTKAEPVQGLRTQHTVMVVDDSLTVRRVTQRLLTREGYQVILAKDGIDALEQLQSVTPDVMLVDIEMPRMDGFDLTRNVRSDARTAHIPIIMITSRTADKHRNYAKELGVNEYFGKPYREDDLLEAITGFIGADQLVIV
ncbi:Hpt domain-containing protein [Undibacterium sp. SXout7W]|uniref:Hpt domain-containing protein n=1 Tax=Undibacterium sp. SXout7W TaxID=3413049 RepID=UPI003BF16449